MPRDPRVPGRRHAGPGARAGRHQVCRWEGKARSVPLACTVTVSPERGPPLGTVLSENRRGGCFLSLNLLLPSTLSLASSTFHLEEKVSKS